MTENLRENIERNLKLLRKVAGWSMEELATKIGITKQSISLYEKQANKLTFPMAIALKLAFDEKAQKNELLRYIIVIAENTTIDKKTQAEFDLICEMNLKNKKIVEYVKYNIVHKVIVELISNGSLPHGFFEIVKKREFVVPSWF